MHPHPLLSSEECSKYFENISYFLDFLRAEHFPNDLVLEMKALGSLIAVTLAHTQTHTQTHRHTHTKTPQHTHTHTHTHTRTARDVYRESASEKEASPCACGERCQASQGEPRLEEKPASRSAGRER